MGRLEFVTARRASVHFAEPGLDAVRVEFVRARQVQHFLGERGRDGGGLGRGERGRDGGGFGRGERMQRRKIGFRV